MEKRNNLLLFILTIGVFGILNTEMGFIGILLDIAAAVAFAIDTPDRMSVSEMIIRPTMQTM